MRKAPPPDAVVGDLGETNFPNSGAAAAQPDFMRGLLLLHSFEFDAARKAFRAAQSKDPGFAMAYWGEALSYNMPIWDEQDLAAARAALQRFGATSADRLAKAPTERERGYLAAVEALYGDGTKPERDASFNRALGELAARFPDDQDARSFYALSWLGLTGSTRNTANYMRAAAEAEAVYEINPRHPGALHYLIHAYDDPVHAPLGLRAARRYGKIAPAASHAQHMPSHIFFALGMWDDAIEANVASLATARSTGSGWLSRAGMARIRVPAAGQARGGRETPADRRRRPRTTTDAGQPREPGLRSRDCGSSRPAAPSRLHGPMSTNRASRRRIPSPRTILLAVWRQLGLATSQPPRRCCNGSGRVPKRQGNTRWGSVASRYDSVTPEELAQGGNLATALEGAIRFAQGKQEVGLQLVRDAAARSDAMAFEYGPPYSAKPLDELLGDLLLAAGKPAEAASAYEKTLVTHPNRRLSVAGLAAAKSAK